jgi:hypothetical protein
MKYKILAGCKLYDQLDQLRQRLNQVQNEASYLATKLEAKEWVPKYGPFILGGGISGLRFSTPPGPNWKRAHTKHFRDTYMPHPTKKVMQIIRQSIDELPTVSAAELNDLLNFDSDNTYPGSGGQTMTMFHPAIKWMDDIILIGINEALVYTPVDGMIEITATEYKELSADKKVTQPS